MSLVNVTKGKIIQAKPTLPWDKGWPDFCRSLWRPGLSAASRNGALAPRPGGKQTHACFVSPFPFGYPKTEQLSSCSEMYSGPHEDGLCPADQDCEAHIWEEHPRNLEEMLLLPVRLQVVKESHWPVSQHQP